MKKILRGLSLSIALATSPVFAANQGSVQVPTTGPMNATTFTNNFLNPALLATFTSSWGPSPPSNGPGAAPSTYQHWMDTSTSPSVLKVYDGSSWVPMGALDAATHSWSLNVITPAIGSYWSDRTPFTASPIFRVRDRLCVDDGCLIPANLNSGAAAMPNTRAGAAINAVGSNWQQPPIRSSVFALSSISSIAISGMTNTSLNPTPTEYQASQTAIALLGMALADHPTVALPAWGLYLECARTAALGFCFGTEIEVGNTVNDAIPLSVYAPEPAGRTIGIHLYSGGAVLPQAYFPASGAMDIGSNGGTFEKGIVYRNGAIANNGGVFDAIDFPSSHRINWQRSNSGADQLQAYITASNTTVSAPVQSINFGASNTMVLTAPTVQATGQFNVLSGSGAAYSTLQVGRTGIEGGLAVAASINQVFTGTAVGDFIVEAGTNLWLGANVTSSSIAGIKIGTTGAITLPQLASIGMLQTNGSGVVSTSLNIPSGMVALSGNSATAGSFSVGRTAYEGTLAVPGAINNPFTGAAIGDFVVEANTNLWLAVSNVGASSTPVAKFAASTGILTLSQYGAGIVQTSGSGVVSSSTTLPAITLGGAVAGGGQNITNVNVGTSSPGTGAFTTASASTSVTGPIVAGGSGASSTLTLESTSGTGTSDSVIVKTGSQVTRGTIATGGQWSFGPNAPTASYAFDFNLNAVNSAFTGLTGTTIRFVAADAGAGTTIDQASFGATGNTFRGILAGGTMASKTATPSGSSPHNFLAYGYDGTAFQLGGAYQMTTTQLWSGTARGLKHVWYVTPDSTTTLTLGLTLESAGNLLVAGMYKSSVAPTAVSGAGPIAIGSASTINSRMKVNLNGTDYWVPLTTTAF